MAWAPTTNFENDLVDYQPEFHLVHGQLAYELKRKKEFTSRPKSTYEYLAERDKRNDEIKNENASRSEKISDSLAMMERIQQIAGTKPLGEHACMSDWEDTSTVEQEAIAMMRHFGMNSMADGALKTQDPMPRNLPPDGFYVIRNGRHRFPLIMDPEYFEPGRKINSANASLNDSDNTFFTADSESNQDDESYEEIPYELLKEEEEDETSYDSEMQ